MKKIYLVILGIIFSVIIISNLISATQTYLNESWQWKQNLTISDYSALSWGDIDNNGYLDLIKIGQSLIGAIGTPKSNIYINNGTSFIESPIWEQNLTNVQYGSIDLGDINNDGKLDLVLSGCNANVEYISLCDVSKIKTIVYINNGTSFIESPIWEQNLTNVYRGTLTLGDINNDGKLDLVLSGETDINYISKIYINNGTNFIENSEWENNLTGVTKSSVVWGDIDNDRKLDLILSGRDISYNKLTKVYLNNGTSLNENSIWEQNLASVDDSSLALADFDNDGDLDLSLTGCCDLHRIYRNNGTSFVEINREISGGLVGVFAGSQAFGDYNNDGYLDLIINGREGYTTLYLYNSTNNNFTNYWENPESNIMNLYYSSIVWLDLDKDNDLDLIQTGWGGGGGGDPQAFVYLSNRSLTRNNTFPTPPSTFISEYSIVNNTLTLTWNNGSDNETPSTGLYYNLMAGNSTTNHTIVSGIYGGSSNPTAGYFGNMMQRKNITLNVNLSEGDYYWYVQIIDTGLAKSDWSERQNFTVSSDITSPVISSVSSSSVTSSTATITWTTDENANSTVYYGTTTSTISFSGDATLTQSHSISLSSLSASTLYYYNVSSCDASGNCNTSQQGSFTTSSSGGNPGGGSSGGGSPSTGIIITNKTIPKFDIDFSNSSGGNIEAKQGDIKTFSLQGEIKHFITLISVASNSITLLITSEPITIQVTQGEVKQIDINGDNINDIEIKLISIISGKAKFSLLKLSGADIVAREEIEENIRKEALFDAKISISNLFQIVKSGREVIAKIEVFNVNNIGQTDVTVDYYITSKENNATKLTEGSDTLAVEAVASFVRSLIVPYNTKAGVYYFNIEVKYKDNILASSHAEFRVMRTYEVIIVIGIFLLIVAGGFIYLWKIKKGEESLERKEKGEEKEMRLLKKREDKLERKIKKLEKRRK